MSEGPQVKLRAEWLDRYLTGRAVINCTTSRPALEESTEETIGRTIKDVFCKGKHIFLSFGEDLFLHNHLLMRGKWKRVTGQLLFLPPGAWLSLYVGPYTILNINGQVLATLTGEEVREKMDSLGPDVLADPFPAREIDAALHFANAPIGDVLLDQSILCGVGNVAKSEALFLAGIGPWRRSDTLSNEERTALMQKLRDVMWGSYRSGGRWVHRVYRRAGGRCPVCHTPIRMMRQGKAKRITFFCPSCQKGPAGFEG